MPEQDQHGDNFLFEGEYKGKPVVYERYRVPEKETKGKHFVTNDVYYYPETGKYYALTQSSSLDFPKYIEVNPEDYSRMTHFTPSDYEAVRRIERIQSVKDASEEQRHVRRTYPKIYGTVMGAPVAYFGTPRKFLRHLGWGDENNWTIPGRDDGMTYRQAYDEMIDLKNKDKEAFFEALPDYVDNSLMPFVKDYEYLPGFVDDDDVLYEVYNYQRNPRLWTKERVTDEMVDKYNKKHTSEVSANRLEKLGYRYGGMIEMMQRGAKAKRGFFGWNEDEYGDEAGRYTFSRYRSPEKLAWQADEYRYRARMAEKNYKVCKSLDLKKSAERFWKKAEELDAMAKERRAGNEARKAEWQEKVKASQNESGGSYRAGGRISITNNKNMRYYNYFEKGGRVARNPRMYQTGGTADSQTVQQQLVALVQAAYQGNEEAQTQIQQIMQAAQQGNQQAMQLAQLIQQIIQAMQGNTAAQRRGGQINYVSVLRNRVPQGYEVRYVRRGGKIERRIYRK